VSQTVDEGETVSLGVAVNGNAPLTYQWWFNGTNQLANGNDIGGATTSELTLSSIVATHAGVYSVVVTNIEGAATSVTARITINPILSLAEALDTPNRFFTTGGDMPWEGRKIVTHDGMDAARSGVLTNGQSSSMETIVDGPGSLSFWWKVSSETNGDVLAFLVNGQPEAYVSGQVEWQQQSLELPPGPQLLEWAYFKNGSAENGADRGWVDQLLFIPAGESFSPAELPSRGIDPRISIVENKAQLSWTARGRHTYEVWYTDDLAAPNWQLLDGEVSARWTLTGGTVQSDFYTATVEEILGAQTRFYRVLEYSP
jgi:hypothetical protein